MMHNRSIKAIFGATILVMMVLGLRLTYGQDALFVAPNGNIGIGTSDPGGNLHIFGETTADIFNGIGPDVIAGPAFNFGYSGSTFGRSSGFFNVRPDASAAAPNPSLRFMVANVQYMMIDNQGYLGVGNAGAALNPSQPLHMASGAYVTTGGVWTDASSRDYKENIYALNSDEASAALKELTPVRFNYKVDSEEKHLGFIAEEVPELVASNDRKGLSSMDIVALLTKVVQDQQEALQTQRHTMKSQWDAMLDAIQTQRAMQTIIGEQQQKITELSRKVNELENVAD